jgi:non-heme chloroperoxidase
MGSRGLTQLVTSRGIAYGIRGSGASVVLLHGWCLNRRLWMYQEEALAQRFRVITPDLPGFGLSAGLDGPYSLERYADELDLLLAELECASATIVGFAFGAVVAMALAARGSSEVALLVLISMPSAAHAPYERMPRSMRRDWPEFARRSAQAICKNSPSQATLDWLEGLFVATPLPVALSTVELLAAFEPLPLARFVTVPTLVVHGALDDIVPPDVSRACAEQMPRARVEVVPNAGHLVLIDQKDRLTELLLEFLSDVS